MLDAILQDYSVRMSLLDKTLIARFMKVPGTADI